MGKPSLNYTRWYQLIKTTEANGDPEKFADALVTCLGFFEEERKNAERMFVDGQKLMDVIKNHMSYVGYYDTLHTELELLDELFTRKLRKVKARVLNHWDKNPPGDRPYTKKDLDYLLEEHEDVIEASEFYDLFHEQYKQYSAIMKSLENAAHTIRHITSLRIAGQEAAIF